MNKAPRFRIELTRSQGYSLLEYVRQSDGLDEFTNASDIEAICEKIRTRMGLNGEKYGER